MLSPGLQPEAGAALPSPGPGRSAPACAQLSLDFLLFKWRYWQLSASGVREPAVCAAGALSLLTPPSPQSLRHRSRWPPASISSALGTRYDWIPVPIVRVEAWGSGGWDQCRGHTALSGGASHLSDLHCLFRHIRCLQRHLLLAAHMAEVITPEASATPTRPRQGLCRATSQPVQAPVLQTHPGPSDLRTEPLPGPADRRVMGSIPGPGPGPGRIPGLQVWVPAVACAGGNRKTSLPHLTVSLCVPSLPPFYPLKRQWEKVLVSSGEDSPQPKESATQDGMGTIPRYRGDGFP